MELLNEINRLRDLIDKDRARVAALDAENKRLREEVKQKTSALWFIENGGAEGVSNSEMVCLMRQEARAVIAAWHDAEWKAALAQTDGKAGAE
jgi:hypothetical protein